MTYDQGTSTAGADTDCTMVADGSSSASVDRGAIRDALVRYLSTARDGAAIAELEAAVQSRIGRAVGSSSVRSYLNLNTPGLFERIGRGRYRLAGPQRSTIWTAWHGCGKPMRILWKRC